MTSLGVLPGGNSSSAHGISGDGTTIVGEAAFGGYNQAFRWTAAGGMEHLGVLPGGRNSLALAANSDGTAVVGWSADGQQTAFRWTAASGMQSLGSLGPTLTSAAYGISSDGNTVVGVSGTDAFLWTSGLGMISLQSRLTALGADLAGWSILREARGISADGRFVVGYGVYNGATRAFIADLGVIPGPGAAVPFLVIGLLGSRRRRT
jgi:probable HAF family extracellular repeat protein